MTKQTHDIYNVWLCQSARIAHEVVVVLRFGLL